ncbi:penicillin-binding transpeptidase domain-containing protein [Haloimpatiens sp. FM7330]|uniref:penicillin-binding transpeptidase domain-containing protein n=1 Tax=Haloimpatiens sp. FM7330 TaxID=3298610 RepID=UPI0036289587
MSKNNKKKKYTRYTAMYVCVCIVMALIIRKLVYIQVIKADQYSLRADKNSIRNITQDAPRGDIVDRNGVVLATSKQSFNLTYMETKESKKVFFDTMKVMFKILDENKEKQEDDFPLKVNPYAFDFKAVKDSDKKWMELRFKKDRGLNDVLSKKYYKKEYKKLDKKEDKEKIKKIEDDLLKISPEETFKMLSKQYGLDDKNFSLEEKRRYMVIKDAIKMQSFSGYKPVVIAKNIKRKTAFEFYERLSELPGINVGTEPIRYYPYGELASSVIGYISKINSMNQEKYEEKGYDVSTDYVGTDGIEQVYESRLKGSKGQRTVRVNKYGRIVEELFKKSPYPGQNIKLTIDSNVQNAAEKALDDTMEHLRKNPRPDPSDSSIYTANATRGAAVAVDIKTGEILALASRPGFDPNIFTIPGKLDDEASKKYFNPDLEKFGKQYIGKMGLASGESGIEKKINQMFPLDPYIENNTNIRMDMYDIVPKPFFNYATRSLMPPGSTFKPLTAIAGLEEGVVTPSTTVNDTGVYLKYGNKGEKWHCWKRGGHGVIDVIRALKESCNYYFYTVGDLLYQKYNTPSAVNSASYDAFQKYGKKFGLGVKSGIEIPENQGHVYNLKNSKEINSMSAYYNARNILKEGIEKGRGIKFKAINIVTNDSDSEEVKKIKSEIKTIIKEAVETNPKTKASAIVRYTNELENKLKKLVETYPKDKQKEYKDSDFEKGAQAVINYCIYDANMQIYTPGNMINAAIGQGDHQFTPIQLANYAATIANGGYRNELHLFKQAYDDGENVVEEKKTRVLEDTKLKSSTIEAVQKGMLAVASGEGGTAAKAFRGFPIETSGKTGSSTFSQKQKEIGRTSYGVYVGYAPYDKPEIAVCVVIFDGGHGGYVAPVARAMYEAYFKKRLKEEFPSYTPKYNYPLDKTKNVIQNGEEEQNKSNNEENSSLDKKEKDESKTE